MDAFLTADGLLALATLTAMEIVLGIDNVVFIAILAGRLPAEQQGAGAGSWASCWPWGSASACWAAGSS